MGAAIKWGKLTNLCVWHFVKGSLLPCVSDQTPTIDCPPRRSVFPEWLDNLRVTSTFCNDKLLHTKHSALLVGGPDLEPLLFGGSMRAQLQLSRRRTDMLMEPETCVSWRETLETELGRCCWDKCRITPGHKGHRPCWHGLDIWGTLLSWLPRSLLIPPLHDARSRKPPVAPQQWCGCLLCLALWIDLIPCTHRAGVGTRISNKASRHEHILTLLNMLSITARMETYPKMWQSATRAHNSIQELTTAYKSSDMQAK
jgi:hypothetical protein